MKFKRIGHYKYELLDSFSIDTDIRPDRAYFAPTLESLTSSDVYFVGLAANGNLQFSKGYAWDGASGPAMDTQSIMRGALVHDGLYQLMRNSSLPLAYRKSADKLLRRMCREDGMVWIRAWWVYWAVRIFGKESASGGF